ncbi:MAG TPA: hypothetical protein QGG47_00025 [Acidobacteriota bacterium]|nr:hypothetical protein [Acidobacteriota bacterium]
MADYMRMAILGVASLALLGAQTETLSGTLLVKTLDDRAAPRTQYILVGDEDQRRVLLVLDRAPDVEPGARVAASGRWLDKVRFRVDSLEVAERRVRTDGPLVRTPMVHRVAILAMEEANLSAEKALGEMDTMERFYDEVSRGVDRFRGNTFRKYSIDYAANDCLYDNTDNLSDALIEAFEEDGFDADNFDHIATVVPSDCGSDWSGAWAYIGGIRNDGAPFFETVSMYKDDVYDPWYLAHELGHNLGMNHARSMECGGPVYYSTGGRGCSFQEYGNYNDVMGNGEGVHFSGYYQRYLGWIGAKHVVTAGRDGEFNLLPVDAGECGIQALRVPIPGEGTHYFYVEFRQARKDSTYPGTGRWGKKHRDSVLVTRSEDGNGRAPSSNTDRIEMDTGRYVGAKQGRAYDLGNGVSVKVASIGSYARVLITMPGNKKHRDDNGDRLLAESDGSLGATACSTLNKHQRLEAGDYLRSTNMRYTFGMSRDGNLELLKGAQTVWSADTCCSSAYAIMQGNGGLVVYDGGDLRFSSGTAGNKGAELVVRNNGTAVILDKQGNVIWSTEQ